MTDDSLPQVWGRRHGLLAMCFLAMFIAYTDRVNISVASVAMREQFGWTQTVKGIVLKCQVRGAQGRPPWRAVDSCGADQLRAGEVSSIARGLMTCGLSAAFAGR